MEFIPDTVIAHRGRVIKNLGDEVLFVTDDAASAAQIALRLLEEIDTVSVSTRTGPGARGARVRSRAPPQRRRLRPVVNIAARIARQGTVRADTAMATALADSTEFTLAAPRAASAGTATAHLPAAPNPPPGAYGPHLMTGQPARWCRSGGVAVGRRPASLR